MTRYFTLAFSVFLLCVASSYSQDKTIDSLRKAFQNPKLHDTTRLAVLSTIMGERYSINEPNYYVLNSMLEEIAMRNHLKRNPPKLAETYAGYLAEAYSSAALGEERKRDFVKAFAYIEKSIALYRQARSYENMHFAIVTKGTLYSDIQEYEKAIACFFKALKYFENAREENSESGVSYVYTYLGQIYLKQKKFEQSIHYYEMVNRYFDGLPDMTAQDKHERSYVYGNIGHCYSALKKYSEAIESYNRSIALAKSIGDQATVDMIMGKIANVKMNQMKYDEAAQILQQTIQSASDPVSTTAAYISLGKLHQKKNALSEADSYLSKGMELAKKYKQLELQEEASGLLYEVSSARNDFKKALDMYVLHEKLVDSSKTEASKNALVQQQLKHDFDKRELNLKLDAEKKAAAKNNWLIGLSSVLLVFLLGGYFYYRNSKQRQAIAALEKNQIKQKLLITQMNPHFIFNSIVNIRGLIADKKNDEAIHYLNQFSTLTRQILQNSNENYISLGEEVEMIQHYLSIQQLLYSGKFSFSVDVDKALDPESIFLPPMLTQPFIENAIKHGLSNTVTNGRVDIRFFLNDDKLYFEVTDNGKGFEAVKMPSQHKSLAMTITKERLVNYTRNGDFVVQADNIVGPNASVVGAKVVFEIPYIYEN